MRVCCCVLAGTKACDNCSNGPSSNNVIMRMPVFPGEMKVKSKIRTSTSLK